MVLALTISVLQLPLQAVSRDFPISQGGSTARYHAFGDLLAFLVVRLMGQGRHKLLHNEHSWSMGLLYHI